MGASSFKYLLKEGFKNIWVNRMMSLASAAILICCLILTGVAVLFTLNMNVAMNSVETGNSVQVYLDDDLTTLEGVQIGDKIKALDNVASVDFISKDEAIQNYIDLLEGEGEILDGLMGEENPLPNAYKVSFKDLSLYKETAEQIKEIPGVQKINDYSDIAMKLTIVHNAVLYGGMAIVIFLAIVSLLIISNTVRVTLHSRKLEISIMRSVGATSAFIRIPFLVEAGIIGLFSGAVACGLIIPAYQAIYGAVLNVVPSLALIPLSSVIWWIIAGALVIGTGFGVCSGFFAISRYLRKEGSESLA